MSLYYRSLIENGLLLDTYPNAAAAYSLRKLRSAYTGNAIRIRRPSDNAELDIDFNSDGSINNTAIEDFFGNNLILQSQNFENGVWGKSNAVVTANSIVGPNGVDLSCKLDENTVSTQHTLTSNQFITTVGRTYLFSVYLKAGERNIVIFGSALPSTPFRRATLNLTTGTIVSNTFDTTPTLTNAGNGWWKFEIIITSNTTSIGAGYQIGLTNGTTLSYAGTAGWGCYIWGAQASAYSGRAVPYFRTTTIAANSAFVTTFYDQSGSGNNAIQSTFIRQPLVVINGFTLFRNNKQYIRFFQGVTPLFMEGLLTTPIATVNNSSFLAASYNSTSVTATFGLVTTATNNQYLHTGVSGTSPFPLIGLFRNTSEIPINGLTSTLDQIYLNSLHVLSSTDRRLFINNTNSYSNTTSSPSFNATYISLNRIRRTDNFSGFPDLFEYILYPTEQTAVRTGIETNINNYYGIY